MVQAHVKQLCGRRTLRMPILWWHVVLWGSFETGPAQVLGGLQVQTESVTI